MIAIVCIVLFVLFTDIVEYIKLCACANEARSAVH